MNPQEQPPASTPSHKPRCLTVGYFTTNKPGVDVPFLRLFGRWMQDAGFVIGRRVKVEVAEGMMTIEQLD
jgi:hypothetical protein